MNADGSNRRQLTEEEFTILNNPTWSPDGQYIAARKHFTTGRSLGTGEIWMYHLAGGQGVSLVERPDPTSQDRKSVVQGKCVSVRVDLGGRWCIKKKINII